jgi:hypothetical protein
MLRARKRTLWMLGSDKLFNFPRAASESHLLTRYQLIRYKPQSTDDQYKRVRLSLTLNVLEGPGCQLQGGCVIHVAAGTCPVR